MRRIAVWMLFAAVAGAQTPSAATPGPVRPGIVIKKVVCAANPAQDYALYLPSTYDARRKWPIIYAFDAAARGALPVELAQAAAERYGFIIAGSNQSSNFNPQAQRDAVECLLTDTHARFSLDDARIYVAGFSGGARLASLLAMNCEPKKCAAGVIAVGAGFAGATPPKTKVSFDYFAAVGELDFNHPEVVEVHQTLSELGVASRLRVFPGPHAWAPAEVWLEALAWLQLRAMKRGVLPPELRFIAAELELGRQRAAAAESSNPLAAWREYQRLAEDLDGLVAPNDVDALRAKAQAMRDLKAVKDARRREREAAERQQHWAMEIKRLILQIDPSDGTAKMQASLRIADLRSRAAKENDAAEKVILQRALSDVQIMGMESAQADRQQKDWLRAGAKTEAVSASVEKPQLSLVQAARDYVRGNDKRAALRVLKHAVDNGYSDQHALESDDFAALRESEQFRKLLTAVAAPK